MSTARDFCTLALKEAGVLGIGQSALAEDINDVFTLLNRMMATWQKKRWLIPSLYEISNTGNSLKSNKIGPGQFWNAPRPDKIQTAYFIQKTNDTGNQVSFTLRQVWSWEDYAKIALKELNSWPTYFFYDGAFPFGNVYIWPIPDDTYEIHLVCKSPIGFTIEIENGIIKDQGDGYINGNYIDIPAISLTGVGSDATFDVTVTGNKITSVIIHNPGQGFKINDDVTIDNSLMGGVGAGFIYNVTEVTDDLDAEFNMPPEYEEAIHYNLCIRICTMYQYPVNLDQKAIAKSALNTIRVANAQIPTLSMPDSLRFNRNNSFYIFNADAR